MELPIRLFKLKVFGSDWGIPYVPKIFLKTYEIIENVVHGQFGKSSVRSESTKLKVFNEKQIQKI